MPPVNADNPKLRAQASKADAPGGLEDRIDSLLSEMQESLDEINGAGDDPKATPKPTARARTPAPEAPEPTGAQDEALAAALDEAVAQAERALTDDDAPPIAQTAPAAPTGAAAAVLDPEMDIQPAADADVESEEPATLEDGIGADVEAAPEPEAKAPAPAPAVTDAPPPIDALDEQLAQRAESLDDEPPPIIDRGPAPKPAPAPTKAAPPASTADDASDAAPARGKSKPKIAVRKRDGADADTGAPAPKPVSAPKAAQATSEPPLGAVPDEPAPVAAASSPGAGEASPARAGLPVRVLETVARPLVLLPPSVRDYLGWFGLLTAFNAACVWIFWVLLRA